MYLHIGYTPSPGGILANAILEENNKKAEEKGEMRKN
jgi:hypothetical protein